MSKLTYEAGGSETPRGKTDDRMINLKAFFKFVKELDKRLHKVERAQEVEPEAETDG